MTLATGKQGNATDANTHINFPVTMRAKPTISTNAIGDLRADSNVSRTFTTINNYLGTSGGNMNITGGSGGATAGYGCMIQTLNSTVYIDFTAEL